METKSKKSICLSDCHLRKGFPTHGNRETLNISNQLQEPRLNEEMNSVELLRTSRLVEEGGGGAGGGGGVRVLYPPLFDRDLRQ